MKTLIFFLTLVTAFTLRAIGQDNLEWNEKRKLTIDDFKGAPPDPSKKQTLIAVFGIEKKLEKLEIEKLQTFNRQVANLFSSENSWIDGTEKSRLRYAITLFDLNEWKARELRKRLNENRELVLLGRYQDLEQALNSEFEKIRQEYDNETDFGNNPIQQMNWETRINERLYSLSDFCKFCTPKKN